MNRHLNGILLVALLALAVPAAAAGTPSSPALFPDYHGDLDGPVFMATDAQGNLWAAWSYKQGLEYDIAVSRAVGRTWEPPVLLGAANGSNDLDPQIGFVSTGDLVVVWWQDGDASQLMLSSTSAGAFGEPRSFGDSGARKPAILGTQNDVLVVGYTVEDGGVVTESIPLMRRPPTRPNIDVLPLPGSAIGPTPDGGTNGPDPMPTVSVRPEPPRKF